MTNNASPIAAATAAIDQRDLRALERLFDTGLDPSVSDAAGQTLLMSAAGAGFVEGVDFLLRAGADVHARTPDQGLSALMYAVMALSDDSVRLLLEAGADPRAITQTGQTVLDVAKDRLRAQFILRLPFKREHHIILSLPAWNTNHPVINRLLQASKERAASSRARPLK